jgi:glycosyltransferase involved in cell wall biosynthesis
MRTIAELMAKAGHQVRCVATTAMERRGTLPGVAPWGLNHRDVVYSLVNVDVASTQNWRNEDNEKTFTWAFTRELEIIGPPDLLLCYGGHPTDAARYNRAKRAGVKIVFGLRNYGYQKRGFFDFCDGVITSSQFLTDWYKTKFGIDSTPLPLPIWPEDVIAEKRDPIYFTAINPTREKGLRLLETVWRHLGEKRPDIPLMAIDSSDSLLCGYYPAIVKPWQPNPRDIFAQTKVLLVPSVWEEPAGRVIAEAMLNGIPPIITDRGGMPEVANGGAIVIPLDKRITPERTQPVPLSVAQPWIDAIIELQDHPECYATHASTAEYAASIYENVTPLYEDYFGRILTGTPIPARPHAHIAPSDEANNKEATA